MGVLTLRFFRRKKHTKSFLSNQKRNQKKVSSFQSLEEIKQEFKQYFGEQEGIIYRKIILPHINQKKCLLIFISEITNQDYISDQIIQPIKTMKKQEVTSFIAYLEENILTTGDISTSNEITTLFDNLLMGKALLFIEGEQEALSISVDEWKGRSVEESPAETAVRGPRESFTENMNVNKALIRKRIKSNKLRFKSTRVGKYTQTNVSIVFIQGIAKKSLVKEIEKRINKIDLDGVVGSNIIGEKIIEQPYAILPTVGNTERTDSAAALLLEGKVLIIVDGTPFLLVLPVAMTHFFQTAEDYYLQSISASLIRILRFFAFLITLYAPSIYIALTTFHQEMIPTMAVSNIAAQREGVPFPAFLEAFMMEVTFEILREAGVRMPKMVGQAVSVVGAIVIGQAAVDAGFVSAAMVIVVAITAIASFVIPSYNMANSVRILRFIMMIFAGSFGFYGIMISTFMIVIHLSSLQSFGMIYTAPISPFYKRDQKDTFIRLIRTTFSSKGKALKENKE